MLKRGGGVCGFLCPWCGGGGGLNQLLGVGRRRRSQAMWCGGNFQLKYGDDRIFVLLAERGARAQSCLVD